MRPVPLEHFMWAGKELHKIVNAKGQFLEAGYKEAGEALRRKQDKEREAAGLPPVQRTGGRGGAPVQTKAKDLPTGRSAPFSRVGGGRTHSNRGGGQGAPAGAVAPRGGGRGGYGGGGGRRGGFQLDQNVWTHLIAYLRKNGLLPVVNFVFSKKRCEEYAATLSTTDLCDAKEKSEVHIVWEKALNRLKGGYSAEDDANPCQAPTAPCPRSRGCAICSAAALVSTTVVFSLLSRVRMNAASHC